VKRSPNPRNTHHPTLLIHQATLILVELIPNNCAKSLKSLSPSEDNSKKSFGASFERKIALIIIFKHPNKTKLATIKQPNTIVFVKYDLDF